MTPSELITNVANQTFDVRDSTGRNLKVRRISALDRLRLLKAAGPELSQNDGWLNMAALTLAVTEIDGIPRPVPSSERQIEAAISALGDTGLQAVSEALGEFDQELCLFDGSPEGNVEGTPI
jgi:hypothetical protein